MPFSDKNVFEDQYLVRYLVGALPTEEAERLDQLSIADDDFAWRLREVENDLVDSYVRSELDDETHAGFKAFYMATAARRQKVQFAQGLRQFEATNARAERAAKFIEIACAFVGPVFAVAYSILRRHVLCCARHVFDRRIPAGAEHAPAPGNK